MFVLGQRRQTGLQMQVDVAATVISGDGTTPTAQVVPTTADRLPLAGHVLVEDSLRFGMSQQDAFRAEKEELVVVFTEVAAHRGRSCGVRGVAGRSRSVCASVDRGRSTLEAAADAGRAGRSRTDAGPVGGRRLTADVIVRDVVQIEFEEVEQGLHGAARTHSADLDSNRVHAVVQLDVNLVHHVVQQIELVVVLETRT